MYVSGMHITDAIKDGSGVRGLAPRARSVADRAARASSSPLPDRAHLSRRLHQPSSQAEKVLQQGAIVGLRGPLPATWAQLLQLVCTRCK